MPGYSLRRRLLLLAAVWAAAAIVILGGVLAALLAHNIHRSSEERLEAGIDRLVSALDSGGGAVTEDMLPDPLYAVPASGAYWQITDLQSGRVERSRSLWDFTLDAPDTGEQPVLSEIEGPAGQSLLSLTRTISRLEGESERRFRITVAGLRQGASAIEGFGRDMALALAVLFLAILVAAGLQIRFVLGPLGRLRKSVREIRDNNGTGIRGEYPDEIQPLINELNDLLVIRENSLQFARARAADLAHGIKTPLSVFLSLADNLDAKGDHANAALVRELSDEITDRIGYQLQLARLRVRSRSEVIATSLQEALRRVIAVLQRTHEGEKLNWDVQLDVDVAVDIDKHDLIELLGAILENACKWASATIQVRVTRDAKMARLSIADDGPGVTDEQISALGFRGRRFDETRPGTGMGLSIAKDIAALNNGKLGYSRSKSGGLTVELSLPISSGRQADKPSGDR